MLWATAIWALVRLPTRAVLPRPDCEAADARAAPAMDVRASRRVTVTGEWSDPVLGPMCCWVGISSDVVAATLSISLFPSVPRWG